MKSDLIPTVYCASPLHRAAMWRDRSLLGPRVNVISTWHDNLTLDDDQYDDALCRKGWTANFYQIIHDADNLIAYAEHKDRPQGTFVEIGAALARRLPVYLVGNHEWGTWKWHSLVTVCPTLREAVDTIIQGATHDPTKG